MASVKELFQAYMASELPTDGGLIITSFFDEETTYSKYEVTSYNNVKDIYRNDEGIVFQADGYKQFVIVEPASYNKKHIEPAMRDRGHSIPYRFKEVDTYITKRQDKILTGKEPVITYTSFTILQPVGENFAYIVTRDGDILKTVEAFFARSLWQDARVPKMDAEKVGRSIAQSLKKILNPAEN
ncbi:MAG: transposase [Spirochaetota bacterium]